MRLWGCMGGLGAAAIAALSAIAEDPACVVTYAVEATEEISVSGARCDTPALEPVALAFALSRVEGAFRDMLLMQAPVEVEFTFSEAAIRQYSHQRKHEHHQSQEGI